MKLRCCVLSANLEHLPSSARLKICEKGEEEGHELGKCESMYFLNHPIRKAKNLRNREILSMRKLIHVRYYVFSHTH